MTSMLGDLLDDLAAETAGLRAAVTGCDDWSRPTPAPGWTIATQIGHLAWTDETAATAARAATDPTAWGTLVSDAAEHLATYVDDSALRLGGLSRADLLDRWEVAAAGLQDALRAAPAGWRMPWFGPPMSAASMATARLMETWAHGLDVHAALGDTPEPTDRIRHVAHLGVRTRDFAFRTRGLPVPAEEFRVEVEAPSGETWSWGPPEAAQRVTGSAWDLCRLVTQRVHRDDTDLVAVGPEADRWLDIAQAFAGEPGVGRVAS